MSHSNDKELCGLTHYDKRVFINFWQLTLSLSDKNIGTYYKEIQKSNTTSSVNEVKLLFGDNASSAKLKQTDIERAVKLCRYVIWRVEEVVPCDVYVEVEKQTFSYKNNFNVANVMVQILNECKTYSLSIVTDEFMNADVICHLPQLKMLSVKGFLSILAYFRCDQRIDLTCCRSQDSITCPQEFINFLKMCTSKVRKAVYTCEEMAIYCCFDRRRLSLLGKYSHNVRSVLDYLSGLSFDELLLCNYRLVDKRIFNCFLPYVKKLHLPLDVFAKLKSRKSHDTISTNILALSIVKGAVDYPCAINFKCRSNFVRDPVCLDMFPFLIYLENSDAYSCVQPTSEITRGFRKFRNRYESFLSKQYTPHNAEILALYGFFSLDRDIMCIGCGMYLESRFIRNPQNYHFHDCEFINAARRQKTSFVEAHTCLTSPHAPVTPGEESKFKCGICYVNDCSHIIMDCRHMICEKCSKHIKDNENDLKTCPFCRQACKDILKVFWS